MLTKDERERRRHYITGTDMSRILGISPYGGPLTVWSEKKGMVEQRECTPAMYRGNVLESALIKWYAEGNAIVRIIKQNQFTIHKDSVRMAATPDAVVEIKGRIIRTVEAKAATRWTWSQWGEEGTDEIPEHYIPQAILEAAVEGVDQTDVVADTGSELKIFPVKYDAELFGVFVQSAEKFWNDHVLTDNPPTANAADMGTLKRLYPHATVSEYVKANPDLESYIDKYQDIKRKLVDLENEETAITSHLMAVIGDKSGIISKRGRINFKNNKPSNVVDWQAIVKELLGDSMSLKKYVEKYTTKKPGARPLRAYWTKG
jgi:putative phage-type endonuclease